MQAALFDLDGVVVDTESQYTLFWAQEARRLHLPDDFATHVKGQTLTYLFATYFPDPQVQKEITEHLDAFEAQISYDFVPGVLTFLQRLREAGIPTAVVTSSNEAKMRSLYAAVPHFRRLFTTIRTSADTPRSKPAPDCYQLAARALGADIARCVVFEDSINGLRSGRASGARVVALTTSNPPDVVSPLADLVVPNFESLTLSAVQALFE